MNLKKISLIIVSIVFIILSFLSISKSLNAIYKIEINKENRLEIGGISIKIEKVFDEKAKEKGLSGRESLKEGEGMLFVSKEPSVNKMWMKDMHFPIDIIWLDDDMRIISFEENVSPKSFPQSFGKDQYSKYVLEVNAGFWQKNNLKIGDTAFFLP